MKRGLNLQLRLMVLVVAGLLPLALLSGWQTVREAEASTEAAESQLRFAASLVAANHERSIEAARHLLAAIANMPGLETPRRSQCEPYFERLRRQYPAYANIGLVDASGQVVCHANGRIGDFNIVDRPYFREATGSRGFAIGEMTQGRASGKWVIPFGQALVDEARVTGMAFAALDLEHGASVLGNVLLPEGARVIIVDRRGRVVMEHPSDPVRRPGRALGTDTVRQLALAMRAATGEAPDNEGKDRIYATVPTRAVGGEAYLALVSVPADPITQALYARLWRQLVALGLVLLAGLATAWWIGGRMVVRPAKQILGVVRRMESGALEARVHAPALGAAHEFREIGAAFNLMAESLQLRQRELETELGRSRSAYELLDTVLNSMQEGLVAVDRSGAVLMHNRAAAGVLPLREALPPAQEWPAAFGLFEPGTGRLLEPQEMPFARAVRGESGELMLLVRNSLVPAGRLLRCSYQPMQAPDGQAGGLVMCTDVTALDRAESDLVLLRNAVARLNDIVLITEADPIDAPGPRIVFVNEAFERLTGYSEREALGQNPRMLQGPGTDRATLDRIRAALERRRPVREQLLNYTKAGRPIWLEIDIVPLADEAGRYTHLIAVQRDITGRKRQEEALLANERELQDYNRMLQRMAEAVQALVRQPSLQATLQAVVDQARRVVGAEMAVISFNADAGRAQLISALSLSGRFAQWQELQAQPDGSGVYALVAETGRPVRLTQAQLEAHPRWQAFSGRSHPPLDGLLAVPLSGGSGEVVGLLQLSGKLGGEFTERDEYVAIELAQLASVAADKVRLIGQISELNASLEQRIAERTAELARQEKRYRALAEQAPEIVWNTDPSGAVTYFNRAWYELVGGEPADWLGFGWLSRIHPDDQGMVREGWGRSRATLEPYTGTRRILARDGRWHSMSFRAVPVQDDAGQLAFWVGIDSDITELKAIEAALRDSNQELEAFSYSVSHDLRAPLGAIGGFSAALATKLEGLADDKARHYLSRIQAGVGKMEQLIEALLGLSRVARAPLERQTVDLGALALETLEALQVQQPQRQVRCEVQEGLRAEGDPRLLRILLENLLGNAWKFTGQQADPAITVGREADSGAFFVRDNGVGFDMAHAHKLFSAFQRLHGEREFPGTGIGLATVRRIVLRHGGRVWAESRVGEGTAIRFTLGEPAVPGTAAPLPPASPGA